MNRRSAATTDPYDIKSCSDITTRTAQTTMMTEGKQSASITPPAPVAAARDEEPKNSKSKATTKTTPCTTVGGSRYRKRKDKPDGFPKRPLSAYNIFFKETRQKFLAEVAEEDDGGDQESQQDTNGDKIVLKASMVKRIATMWQTVDEETRERMNQLAKEALARYKDEVRAYEEAETLEKQQLEDEKERWKQEQEKEHRRQKERQEQEDKIEEKARRRLPAVAEERGRLFGDTSFDVLFSRRVDSTSIRGGGDEIQMLLENETRALEMAASFKVRQLSLARQLQASHPQLQVLAMLEKERATLGLAPLSSNSSGDTMSSTRSEELGRRLSPILTRPIFGFNQSSCLDQDAVTRPQAGAMFLGHPLNNNNRLQEEELMMNKLPAYRSASSSQNQDVIFSELAAKRRKLLETERSVASMMDELEDHHHHLSSAAPSYLNPGGGLLRSTSIGASTTSTASSRHLELDSLRLQEEEMTIRIKRLRKKQELAHQLLPPPGGAYSRHRGPEPTLYGELMAQHQKLLAQNRSVSRSMMIDRRMEEGDAGGTSSSG